MAPFRGRGAFRGRGRGGARFRGGRGASNGGFTGRTEDTVTHGAASTAQDAQSDSEDAESVTSESDASASASDEEQSQPVVNAYQALLSSYQQEAARDQPRRKRRKLAHPADVGVEEVDVPDDLENDLEDDELVELEGAAQGDEAQHEAMAAVAEEDDDGQEDAFELHFANPDDNELQKRLKALAHNQWSSEKVDTHDGGKCVLQKVGAGEEARARRAIRSTKDLKLKQRLVPNAANVLGQFSALEQAIVPSIFEYQDVVFGGRTVQNATRLRQLTCLHALNHVFKTRDRVLKNNIKLAREQDNEELECRDQGFTRPKVLFLLETKQACVRAVEAITQLGDFEQQENKKRFVDSYSLPEDKFGDEKPEDFRELFEGNDENEFRIGVKFTRKTIKFYSMFYNSDIIFASTLGLRRAIESTDPKKKDSDFLSSIELVVMEQADATLMQNWEHAEFVFEHLNLQPKEAHGCDFSRVRNWYLDGHAKHLRQTIILSSYLTPKITNLASKHMRNVAGKLKYTPAYPGAIESLNTGIKQTFSRFDSPSFATDPDTRFKYFTAAVVPQLTRLPQPAEGGKGILIFIPSYFDFLRVKVYFADSVATQNISFGLLSEYEDQTSIRRARSHFMSGRHSVLLYTGRAHHFHRYNIRGVKRVIFYGVPENPVYYKEVVDFVGASVARGEMSKREGHVRVVFSKWERMELERVVGGSRVDKMVREAGDTFDFV